jgi:hypothetical protein
VKSFCRTFPSTFFVSNNLFSSVHFLNYNWYLLIIVYNFLYLHVTCDLFQIVRPPHMEIHRQRSCAVCEVMLTFVSLLHLLSSALMTSYVNSFSEIHNIYSPVRHNIKVKQVFVEYCIWQIIQEWLRYEIIVTHMWNTLLLIDNIYVWHIRLWYIWIFFEWVGAIHSLLPSASMVVLWDCFCFTYKKNGSVNPSVYGE